MEPDLSPTARQWLDSVLVRLGVPEWKRHDCAAGVPLQIDGVGIRFLQPASGDQGYVVARAVVGEVPPQGQCEAFFQLVLEVQAMLCGPHTPVVGLDWPGRSLVVSCSIDMSALSADDAAAILCSVQQMAAQWRAAMPPVRTAPADTAVRTMATC